MRDERSNSFLIPHSSSLFIVRADNFIPKCAAHAVAFFGVFEMVLEVVRFDRHKPLVVPIHVMNGVVNHVVAEVAEHETGKKRFHHRSAKQEFEEEIKQKCQRNADRRRHHQPHGVIREVVVNAMHDEMEALPPAGLRFVVKDISVQEILGSRPSENACNEQPGDGDGAQIRIDDAPVQEITNHRHVQNERNAEMNSGKELHPALPEHPGALVFV